MNTLLFISAKGIGGIILLVALMAASAIKLFTKGCKKMKNEERLLSLVSLLLLSIALIVVSIILFN